jgi:NAD(P)-dependent dehydrogenase (short-subunit alcohol dehydrogenase family)
MSLPRTPSFRLEGKRALVTGASSGIGLASAMALAEAGAHVVLAARSLDKLNDVATEMQALNLSVDVLAMDVSDTAAVSATIASMPAFDVLVNSAGMAKNSSAIGTTESNFDAVQGINVKGAYFLTVAVAKRLIELGLPGSLINISSQMGHVGGMDRAVYCASKHAVEGMTKAMAIEWGRLGIRVNTICPTFILTPLTQATFDQPDKLAWIEENIKLGRVGRVEDIMGAVVYLATEASALVTGSALMVDGGWTAG